MVDEGRGDMRMYDGRSGSNGGILESSEWVREQKVMTGNKTRGICKQVWTVANGQDTASGKCKFCKK